MHVQNIQTETLIAVADHSILCLQHVIGQGGSHIEPIL